MGAIPHKALTNRFPLPEENQTSEAPGDEGVETPPPNDSSKASLSPPVGRLCSFSRDWQINKCSSNVLNIITNGYVLTFLSKPNLVRFPLIVSEYKARPKDQALADCIQPLLSMNAIERVENVKSLGFLQSPVSSPQASPTVEAGNRPKQAQHFSTRRKVQNGNSRVHQDLPDSRGVGIVHRSVGCLPPHPHPPKLEEIPKILPQVSGVPVHIPPLRAGHSPPGLYNDCKGSQTNGPIQRSQTSPIPGQLIDQVPVSGGSPSEHSGSGRYNPVLGVNNKSGKVRTETYSGVFVCGLRIPSRFSPCKTHSRDMAQTSGFNPTTQVKTCFDCKMFDVANWVASLNGEDGPGRTPSHETLSVSSQGALEISSVAGQPSAHLDWWQNPVNVMKGADLHPKDHSIQLFTDASNEGWGTHLDQSSTKGLWSDQEKRLHINILELKAVSLALRRFKDQCQDQTVLVATDNSTVVAYINKQRGTHSAEMCALMWKIMTWCHHYHITLKARHIPGCLNVMADLFRSNQI